MDCLTSATRGDSYRQWTKRKFGESFDGISVRRRETKFAADVGRSRLRDKARGERQKLRLDPA
jgi:hypothetical protein